MKATDYGRHTDTVTAFVSTNSICQGQQVPILWPLIFSSDHEIAFAHTSFKWNNLASRNAGVTVAIIGLARKGRVSQKRIFTVSGGDTTAAVSKNINPYLVDSKNIFVSSRSSQLSGLPEMLSGDKMTDGGNLVLDASERDKLLDGYPEAKKIIGRLVGGQELIKGVLRYALIIADDEQNEARAIPPIANRLKAVSEIRAASTKKATQELASTPHKFDETRFVETRKIIVAQRSSENREFYPCDIVGAQDIAMAPSLVIYRDDAWLVSLIGPIACFLDRCGVW